MTARGPLIGTVEAAALLKISESMVARHARNGTLSGIKVGKTWVFTPEAIEAYQNTRRPAGRPKQS